MSELGTVLEFDTDIADQEQPKPLPVGTYIGQITKCEILPTNKDPEKKYIAVTFFIDESQYPVDFTDGNPGGMNLVYRRMQYNNSARAKWDAKVFCQAIGAPTSRVIDMNEWIGRQAKLEIAHGDFQGNPIAEIKKVSIAA